MIELLVVLSLIVILATMGMAQYQNSIVRASEAVLKEDLFRMRDAIDQYYADKNQYPTSSTRWSATATCGRCPTIRSRNPESWQAVPAEPDPNNPTASPASPTSRAGRMRPRSTGRSTRTGSALQGASCPPSTFENLRI